jgi:hypothetical protein
MKPNYLIQTWILIICLGISTGVYAGDVKYKVADIPKQLLKDAKAVVRNEEITVEIKSDGKLVQKVKYAITILNKNGDSDANFRHRYDKNVKVSNIKAQIYDEYGAEYKKKGGFDILDYAMISEGTTYSDQRVKAIIPEHYDYPFTIEYTYEVTISETIQFPGWYPIDDYNVAVEKSKYTLIISKQANCRYFEKNITNKAQIQNTADNNIYTWELNNTEAVTDENLCPALVDITPVVLIAPSIVNVEGYAGNFGTWKGIGLWINQLLEGQDKLNDDTKAKILKLTEGISDDRTKIKKLYEYMQNKTRYVSIQEGIGGFQPFDAETVDRLSYGDCKALSNYMKSILSVVGIKSLYTRVLSGDEKPTLITNFPSNQFNHIILCVPLINDTVWLECTSQSSPFNYLGTFTADREVLVITPDGGKLVRTPGLTAEADLESRRTNVSLDQSGGGIANVKTTYHGATYDMYMGILMSDQADRKKMLTRRIHIPNFELNSFNIQESKTELPFVTEKLDLSITSYCTRVGGKLMLTLNIMNKLGDTPFQSTTRKNPISIKWPVYEVDTVSYDLPVGYTMEKIPSKVNLSSEFGQYTTEVIKSGSTIQYIRTFKVNEAEYPADRYDEIVAFFEKIVTADENKVMLTKVM